MPGGPGRNSYDGVLLINKPLHRSSHDVVQSLRRILSERRIGHVGTLDPLAEGLLVVCVGRSTKIVRFLTGLDKTYEAEITLGRTSTTLDSEGVDRSCPAAPVTDLTEAAVTDVLTRFEGLVTQQVPAYSAVRVNGEPLYKTARRGEEVELPMREITISEIHFQTFENPRLRVMVSCSSGTYIRTLADDIGRALGCGAYLSHLRRTRVGHFDLAAAMTLEQVADAEADGSLQRYLLGYGDVLRFGALRVTDEFKPFVIQGRTPANSDLDGCEGRFAPGDTVLLKGTDGSVLAVGRSGVSSDNLRAATEHRVFDYIRVLN